MSYSSRVSSSYGGANRAAALGAARNANEYQARFRGMAGDGQAAYSYDTGGGYLEGGKKKKKKKKKNGGGAGGNLASQFDMPYRINQQVQSGYEGRETASAGNLAAINSGYGQRMADSAANLDRLNQAYMSREAIAEAQLANIDAGYGARYDRGMANLENSRANELTRIDDDYKKLEATSMQDLVSRGLRNSSLAATKSTGVERARQQSIGDVNESVRRERLAADADLSRDQLASRRDALGIRADLAGQTLNFGQQANATQANLYGDRLGFQSGANDTQNALASERLRFTERTKADYPNWEDGAAYAQQLAAASAQGGYGGYGGYGQRRNGPKGKRFQGRVAGVSAAPLSAYGYDVPNLTTMPAANLASGMRGDMSGFRRDTPFPGLVERADKERADRSARTMARLMQQDDGYQPYTPSTTYEPTSRLNPPAMATPQPRAAANPYMQYVPNPYSSRDTYEPSSRLNPPAMGYGNPTTTAPPSYRYGSTPLGPPPASSPSYEPSSRLNPPAMSYGARTPSYVASANPALQGVYGNLSPSERAYVASQYTANQGRYQGTPTGTYRKPAVAKPQQQAGGFKPGMNWQNLTTNGRWLFGLE